jgi:hypothetical protein
MKEEFPDLSTGEILKEFHLLRKDDFREDYYNRTKRCTDPSKLAKMENHDPIRRIVKKADMILKRPAVPDVHANLVLKKNDIVSSSSSSSSSNPVVNRGNPVVNRGPVVLQQHAPQNMLGIVPTLPHHQDYDDSDSDDGITMI